MEIREGWRGGRRKGRGRGTRQVVFTRAPHVNDAAAHARVHAHTQICAHTLSSTMQCRGPSVSLHPCSVGTRAPSPAGVHTHTLTPLQIHIHTPLQINTLSLSLSHTQAHSLSSQRHVKARMRAIKRTHIRAGTHPPTCAQHAVVAHVLAQPVRRRHHGRVEVPRARQQEARHALGHGRVHGDRHGRALVLSHRGSAARRHASAIP